MEFRFDRTIVPKIGIRFDLIDGASLTKSLLHLYIFIGIGTGSRSIFRIGCQFLLNNRYLEAQTMLRIQ